MPRLRSLKHSATSSASGPLTLGPLGLEHTRQAFEPRLGQKGRAARLSELPLADVGVAVAVGAERGLGVVEMQGREAAEPDLALKPVHGVAQAVGGADVIARREQVTGVQADPQPRAAAGRVDQVCQLSERAPQRASRTRGVLQVQRAAL